MRRRTLSSRLRFEVFKRDRFTCQYCGDCAPDVKLHADHVRPVADGGENHIANLVTACERCNGGKGARRLSDVAGFPFAWRLARDIAKRLVAEREPLQRCYWCGQEICERHEGFLEICDQEVSPFFADSLIRYLPGGGREEVGTVAYPGTGAGRARRGEWSDYRVTAYLAHERCSLDDQMHDVYGYRIGLTRIGSPESLVDWRRQIGTKFWFKMYLCDDLDVAAAASRACDARKALEL